ncbi:hypothetical protein [Butyrivibrio sp. INlla16]|uniref:hypothetical protein n=1 Tax=Butyrivibrio sp. INlla16 TaxID=1520807 RepID=UPI0008881E6F|nr:hypothetical protein [Butyrivibrio sp. INlla16]SDB68504.1 hypothetical protein SAMN02910263_04213 [Butyrivibrio sp. INlla16]
MVIENSADSTDNIGNLPYSVNASCPDNSSITVYGDGSIRILYENAQLPPKYHFTDNNTTDDEANAVLDYLAEEYAAKLGYKEPVSYSCVEKSYSGEDMRSYYMYDGSSDIRKNICNHDLSYASFSPDEEGNLSCIWIYNAYSSSTYKGDYLIITSDKAIENLLSGDYYSSVPSDYFKGGKLSDKDIARVSLGYRNTGE